MFTLYQCESILSLYNASLEIMSTAPLRNRFQWSLSITLQLFFFWGGGNFIKNKKKKIVQFIFYK